MVEITSHSSRLNLLVDQFCDSNVPSPLPTEETSKIWDDAVDYVLCA